MIPVRMALILALLLTPAVPAQDGPPEPDRHVTVVGIVATPGGETTNPQLLGVLDQLRKLKPNHGFERVSKKTMRLAVGASMTSDLGDGLRLVATLVHGSDPTNGKVQLDIVLSRLGRAEFSTTVSLPPNQLFFLDKPLADNARLLIGIGAR